MSTTPSSSPSSSGFFNRKTITGAGALTALGATGIYAAPEVVQNVVFGTAGAVSTVLETGSQLIQSIPVVGPLAPFAVSAGVGLYLGSKFANWTGMQKRWARYASTLAGGVGGLALGSAATPYLVGTALAVGVGKPVLKWALEKTGSLVGGVYGGITGGPVSAAKGVYSGVKNGAKNGWQHPTFVPNTN